MNSPIEYNNEQAKFSPRFNALFIAGDVVPDKAMISLCAWCASELTEPLKQAGYKISHGICNACMEKQLNQ